MVRQACPERSRRAPHEDKNPFMSLQAQAKQSPHTTQYWQDCFGTSCLAMTDKTAASSPFDRPVLNLPKGCTCQAVLRAEGGMPTLYEDADRVERFRYGNSESPQQAKGRFTSQHVQSLFSLNMDQVPSALAMRCLPCLISDSKVAILLPL